MGVLRNAVNPFSTAFSRWWCHSSLRAMASGKPRDFYRQRLAARPVPAPPLDPAVRQARIGEIERVLRSGPG
jgi:hypothetical protein